MDSNELLASWEDLPDPAHAGQLRTLELRRCAWMHFREKHVMNPGEPWADWLTPERLRTLDDPRNECEATELIGKDARTAMQRPLVLVQEPLEKGRAQSWLLVLPSGAQLVVRATARGPARIATCYFRRAAAREPNPRRRWRALVRLLVAAYAVMDQEVNGLTPSGEGVRFVSLKEWGFDEELQGQPWRGRLNPWPEETVASPPPRRRLNPRLPGGGMDR